MKLLIFLPVVFSLWPNLVLLAQTPAPVVDPNGVLNAASQKSISRFSAAVARGEIISILGKNFSSATVAADRLPLQTRLPGTSTEVLFDEVFAPLFYVSPTRINAQVPFELPRSTLAVRMVVRNENGSSAPVWVSLLAQDPGVFSVVKDGVPVSPSNPIQPGESATLFATGLGSVSPPVTSGQPAPFGLPSTVNVPPVIRLGGGIVPLPLPGFGPGVGGGFLG